MYRYQVIISECGVEEELLVSEKELRELLDYYKNTYDTFVRYPKACNERRYQFFNIDDVLYAEIIVNEI